MIKKFKNIKKFGILKDFTWNNDNQLQQFKEKNIIYGWNYSGKTTLSRIFKSLNDKELHPDYLNSEFEIELYDETNTIKDSNLENFLFDIDVFNHDYIRKNLKWDDDEEREWDAIAFDVGEEKIDMRNQIEENNKRITLINGNEAENIIGRKKTHQDIISEFDEFDNRHFTAEATRIREDIFNRQINFDKGTIKRTIIPAVITNLDSHIISDDTRLTKLKSEAIATNSFSKYDELNFAPNYQVLFEKVKELLSQAPEKDIVIDILENNNNLRRWVEEGLEYEENKQTCSFCGNPIDDNRFKELNTYFSNASKDLREEIQKCREEIEDEKNRFNDLTIPRSKNDFTESVQEQIEKQIVEFQTLKINYENSLKCLIDELNRKEDGQIFNSIKIAEIVPNYTQIVSWLEKTNDSIKTHNDFFEKFEETQEEARNLLQKHYVAKYLKDNDYIEKEQKNENAEKWIAAYNGYIQKLEDKNDQLEADLIDIAKGKEKLKDFIQRFLNRSDISIEVTDDSKFLLKRGSELATNLSEGEKTAIAFSYFLVSLEAKIENKKIFDTIIFIDDPVSSLDSNHIAQIYTLINSFFFQKGLDNSEPEKVINCFKQLFISTHNFEFFSFLTDSKKLNKRKGSEPYAGCEYYLIRRIDEDKSSIKALPKSLKNYKSEYILLFEMIFKFNKNNCSVDDENYLLMPNAVRRFLEIYTLMKIPHDNSSVESRVAQLVGNVNQYKILNHFSHFTTFEKITKHDELLMNLPDAVDELINLLNEDETHFNSLKKAINET